MKFFLPIRSHSIQVFFVVCFFSVLSWSETVAVLNEKGIKALSENRFSDAITYFSQALYYERSNKTIKDNLSIAYNNCALSLASEGRTDEACNYLKKGVELTPENTTLKNNLSSLLRQSGFESFKQKNYPAAEKYFGQLIAVEPKEWQALFLLGQIAYNRQDLIKAQQYWQQALAVNPSNLEIQQNLESLKRESRTENNLRISEVSHFDIRYDHTVISSDLYAIKQHLMECYRTVGQSLDYFPQETFVVILMKELDFRTLHNQQEWVAGLYDGKIRLPINFDRIPLSSVKSTICHEYTHALVFSIAGNNCPLWVNEGFAVFEESKYETPDMSVLKQALQSERVLSFRELDDKTSVWKNGSVAPLAYMQSYAMVDYLISRWNYYFFVEMLKKIRTGATVESILAKHTNRTLPEFEREWIQHSRQKFLR
ncbi:MAG: tetratricopeptide repeat protein [Chitinivibrionales bacterium]|nr:tetratricopeptide repeat protein [Chitinivibrionales bacterium]